jgi:hypothetical protein
MLQNISVSVRLFATRLTVADYIDRKHYQVSCQAKILPEPTGHTDTLAMTCSSTHLILAVLHSRAA